MAFLDVTIAQRSADYANITDTATSLISLSVDGSSVLKVSSGTVDFILQQLSLQPTKGVIISTGSTYFLAGDYDDGKLSASLVRIVAE